MAAAAMVTTIIRIMNGGIRKWNIIHILGLGQLVPPNHRWSIDGTIIGRHRQLRRSTVRYVSS